MNKFNRVEFLKMGALIATTPLWNSLSAAEEKVGVNDDDLLQRFVAANDKQADQLMIPAYPGNVKFSRRMGSEFAILAASFCSPKSKYYHSPEIISKFELMTKILIESQSPDGTLNFGNLESPPDTSFLFEVLCPATSILLKDGSKELNGILADLKKVTLKAGDALSTGGVHTPNHRWVVCAALSQINDLYPDKKYTNRIEDWLGEGVFQDSDGHYPERSANYAAVENNSMITMARLLNKPSLFEYARKNLWMTYYYTEPNGDVVATDSRRQDQYTGRPITIFYLQYRYMAIKDNNKQFAAITKFIESTEGFKEEVLNRSLYIFLENSLLQKELPVPVSPSDNFDKLFPTSHLARIRRDKTTATIFGGVDWPLVIASGRSNSPNFFSYRKGSAALKYMRVSTNFFSTGYFYSEGLKKEVNKYVLHKKLQVPYYQPLPKDKRNKQGDYKLSPSIDDRFWNKMDFKNRPVSNLKTLDTTISFVETNGAVEVNFKMDGVTGVQVTIELCFLEGGKLSGVSSAAEGNSFLEKDFAAYQLGDDTIKFGPGTLAHRSIVNLEGERYSTHFGTLKTPGMRVYLTGITPFNHKLVFS